MSIKSKNYDEFSRSLKHENLFFLQFPLVRICRPWWLEYQTKLDEQHQVFWNYERYWIWDLICKFENKIKFTINAVSNIVVYVDRFANLWFFFTRGDIPVGLQLWPRLEPVIVHKCKISPSGTGHFIFSPNYPIWVDYELGLSYTLCSLCSKDVIECILFVLRKWIFRTKATRCCIKKKTHNFERKLTLAFIRSPIMAEYTYPVPTQLRVM